MRNDIIQPKCWVYGFCTIYTGRSVRTDDLVLRRNIRVPFDELFFGLAYS